MMIKTFVADSVTCNIAQTTAGFQAYSPMGAEEISTIIDSVGGSPRQDWRPVADQCCWGMSLAMVPGAFRRTPSGHVKAAAAVAFAELTENGYSSKTHFQRHFHTFHIKVVPTVKISTLFPLKWNQRSMTLPISSNVKFECEKQVSTNSTVPPEKILHNTLQLPFGRKESRPVRLWLNFSFCVW